ncbi:hypothetical protein BAE44_0020576, partial [Dichanthelium oligosanthes]
GPCCKPFGLAFIGRRIACGPTSAQHPGPTPAPEDGTRLRSQQAAGSTTSLCSLAAGAHQTPGRPGRKESPLPPHTVAPRPAARSRSDRPRPLRHVRADAAVPRFNCRLPAAAGRRRLGPASRVHAASQPARQQGTRATNCTRSAGGGGEVGLGERAMAAAARRGRGWARGAAAFAAVALAVGAGRRYGWDGASAVAAFREARGALGPWAAPAYVAAHALTLALCPPYAIFFEGAAALVFGFLPGVACVFSAKVLGASISFWIGRAVFRYFTSAMEWLQRNKYFHVVVKGVERDGWKFVLLARFSPLPSYIINYALSATDVRFCRDFLLPTVIGCLPMILQNVSIVSLAGAAVASTTGSKKSHIYSYLFPAIGIISSLLISWRIKQYSSALAIPDELKSAPANGNSNGDAKLASVPSTNTNSGKTRKRR